MTMKPDEYKEHLLACKNQALDESKELRNVMDECWKIYRNEQDYSKKQKWQSQICIPEGQAAVRKAQGIIRSSLTKPEDFFNIKAGRNPIHMKKRMMQKFRDTEVAFLDNFIDGVGASLALGVGIIKTYYKPITRTVIEGRLAQEMPEQAADAAGGLMGGAVQPLMPVVKPVIEEVEKDIDVPVFEAKDPRTTFFLPEDPYRFVIEEEMFPLQDVLQWADKEGYDKKEIKKLKKMDYSDAKTEEIEERLEAIGIKEGSNQYNKQVLIQRFWGDIVNKDGEIEHKYSTYVLANQKYLIKPPAKIPYWHKKLPFVIWSPLKVVLRKQGQPMLEAMVTIQKAINNLVNLQIDAAVTELLGIPEIDPDKLLNPAEITSLVPGRLIRRRAGAMPGPAVTIDRPASFSNAPIHMVEFLRRAAQNSHFVTDILMGLNTVKGEQATATEISKKGAESSQAFQVISMDIEDNALVPLLEMTASNILQYDDFSDVSDPELAQYKGMDRAMRVMALQGPYHFAARGITSHFEQSEMLNRVANTLQLVSKVPMAQAAVRWPLIMKIIFENSQLPNSDKLALSEQEFEQKMQQQQQMQMQQQQQAVGLKVQSEEKDRQTQLALAQINQQGKMAQTQEKGKQSIQKEIIKATQKSLDHAHEDRQARFQAATRPQPQPKQAGSK